MRENILDEFKNAFNRPNNGLIQIILINVAVFVIIKFLYVTLWFLDSRGLYEVILRYIMLPADPVKFIFQPWSLITYFFTHEGFFHILFNMLFLYWFGKLIQEFIGDQKVISLFVLGGIIGGLLYILLYNILPQFNTESYMLGASAGVFAVVVGAATFMPNYTMYLLLLGPVRIKYIAIFYVLLSFFSIPDGNAGGNIAHLGGAAIGYIYIKQLQKGNDMGLWIFSVLDFFKGFFTKRSNIRVSYNKKTQQTSRKKEKAKVKVNKSGSKPNSPSQDEIDAILDKISQSGYESLSKEEKQKLFSASKK